MPGSEAQKAQSDGGGSINFQFNKIIIVSPGGSILPFRMNIYRPSEPKAMGTGSKRLASGSLVVRMSDATPDSRFHPLIPGPLHPGYGTDNILDADSESTQSPGEPHLQVTAT